MLGWTHRPGSRGTHRVDPIFNATYTIDRSGNRWTGPPNTRPKIIILGGSYTFGYGVEDDETYAAILNRRFQSFHVVNAGALAWGTSHSWLRLRQLLAEEDAVNLVLYGFIHHHVVRNGPRRSWLVTLEQKMGRRNPLIETEEGRPVFKRLADPHLDGKPKAETLGREELAITRSLFEEMAGMCRIRGIPLLLVQLPDGSNETPFSNDFLQLTTGLGNGVTVVDLRGVLDLSAVQFAGDGHPSPIGHRMIADELQPVIESILPGQDQPLKAGDSVGPGRATPP